MTPRFQPLAFLFLLAFATEAGAQVCAAPGRDGDITISGVVNTYWTPSAPGSFGPATTSIALSNQRGAPATVAEGDLMLVIQMQCADINFSNTNRYGDGVIGDPASGYTDPPASTCRAGTYEFVRAGVGSSNSVLSLAGSPLVNTYAQANATATAGRRTVQIVRVPQFRNATLSGSVTAPAWDGFSGGVVALDVARTLNLNGQTINVDGAGFRGGAGRSRAATDRTQRFRWDADTRHATKGEGIAGTPRFVGEKRSVGDGNQAPITDLGINWGGYPTGTASTGDFARGAPGNAGGGGTAWNGAADNGGGGGGGNGGPGGRGGAGWRGGGYLGILPDYSNHPEPMWGFGGSAFLTPGVARLVLGGGGGAGDANNHPGDNASGAAGGGIVMMRAETLTGAGTILARGARATDNTSFNDGAGGGGGGGSVLVVATTWSASLSVDASGGRGGDAYVTGLVAHGTGGGGGGGMVITSAAASVTLNGGAPGVTNTGQNQPGGPTHGAGAGTNGVQFVIPPGSDTPGTRVGRTCKADLRVTKTNTPGVNAEVDLPDDTVASGSTTTYTLTVSNAGPLPANGAILRDTPTAGLTCTTAACSATGGAACPAQTGPALASALLSPAGVSIPVLPVGGAVAVTLTCSVL